MLNKHHCNSKNAFTVCFITAFAKNTCRAGLIHYGVILNLRTVGEMLQLNIEWSNIGFFVSITIHFSTDACLTSFIWEPFRKRNWLFSHLDTEAFLPVLFSKRLKVFLKGARTCRRRNRKFKQRVIITEVRDIRTKRIITQKYIFCIINKSYFSASLGIEFLPDILMNLGVSLSLQIMILEK